MWKVVVTEIQDANALQPLDVPPGAYFVSTERFSRTVENLDLDALIQAIDGMQSPQGYGREERRVSPKRALRRASPVRREAHVAGMEASRSVVAAQLISKIDP